MNIDQAKQNSTNRIKYKLKNATVWSGNHGYTFSLFMDKESNNADSIIDSNEYSKVAKYLQTELQSNKSRFENQVNLIKEHLDLGTTVLDVGCGGGLFLSLITKIGYKGCGVEVEPMRHKYCIENGLKTFKEDVTNSSFVTNFKNSFDAVSYWDVIEHLNYPSKHLETAASLLKHNGLIFIDTPAKDSFYHKLGAALYSITAGKLNIFLNVMYSDHPFGHKQIFSTTELRNELESAGFKIVQVKLFHELSFPYEFYLQKIVKIKIAVRLIMPFVNFFFRIFPIKNKMLIVGKKI